MTYWPETTARCAVCEQAYLTAELREEAPNVFVCIGCDRPDNRHGVAGASIPVPPPPTPPKKRKKPDAVNLPTSPVPSITTDADN